LCEHEGVWAVEGDPHEHAERIAAQGQRVIALAMKPAAAENTVLEFSDAESGLSLLMAPWSTRI
jgi:hypothetical protein